jgi:cellulose synthase/poly-beta-1,6-N-acetylglucosamine synthase-like glycosyltransferase
MVPAYDAEAYVREAVESALAQTEERLEVIVVDDGSAVDVREALTGVSDARLRVVRHRRNRGLPAARNTAVRRARSPYVSQLDADDTWHPAYLESVLPAFDDPAVGLVYANAETVGAPPGIPLRIPDASVHPMDRFPKIAEQNPIPSPTATMRTTAVRGVGGYAEWLWGAEDYHLYCKLVAAGWRFAYVDRPLARYRWPSSASGMSHQERRLEREVLKMWIAFVLRHPRTPGPRRQVRTRLRREWEALWRAHGLGSAGSSS